MTSFAITPRDRVNEALAFRRPDRTPRDFAAAPEIWAKLGCAFRAQDRNEILRRSGRRLPYHFLRRLLPSARGRAEQVDMNASLERSSVGGMWRRVELDGSNRDIWARTAPP